MQYDFDIPINRRETQTLKWGVAEGELPMWVADMDFQTAPEIIDTLKERVNHGIFGYSIVPDEWEKAIMEWWSRRHDFQVKQEWLIFCTGVVPAISSAVRKLTTQGENVLIQTPVYNIFFHSIINNGRNVLESPLQYDGESYCIDFTDLESKLADPQTSLMILCNPHNPVGKIWDREVLARIGELCAKHHVIVISDEIHCDLTDPGQGYIPFAAVSETCAQNSITCIAPTKAFNLAGLQTAAVIAPNPVLRHRINRALNTDEVAEPNAFAIGAAVTAFTKGEAWLNALRLYLYENKQLVREFLAKELPELKLVPSRATYLLWIDCGKLSSDANQLARFLCNKTGLYLSDGNQYGGNGNQFLRMNIACPRMRVQEGLQRLKKGVVAYQKERNIGSIK